MEESPSLRAIGIGAARGVIRLYQLLSAGFAPRCRFTPSCSEYAREALASFGFFGGAWRTARRLLKCHPWHPGGWDPIKNQENAWNKRIS